MATILQFLIAAKRQLGPLPDVPGLDDPLNAIVVAIKAAQDTPEARTLAMLVKGIKSDSGAFAETDIYNLDRRSLALVVALAEDRVQGRYSHEEWEAALNAIRS